MKYFLCALAAALAAAALAAQSPDPRALLAKVDSNEIYQSIVYEGDMAVDYQGKHFVKTMKAWARANNDAFIEFTNREDRGTKYLKKDGRLYVWSPDTEETMLIAGHMLKESMMGSDMSYEDTTENAALSSRYTPALAGSDSWNGADCWVLELSALGKTESYPRRKLWIDKASGDLVHYELYALSGGKLKEYTLLQVDVIGGKRFPVRSEVRDLLRKGSTTTFTMRSVRLDEPIPDSVFSTRNLER